jgi:DNA-binding beta-propeller fold protein YncE
VRIAALLALLLPLSALADTPQRAVDQGIAIEFAASPGAQPQQPFAFRFTLSDAASGKPLAGLRPAAWLGLRKPGDTTPAACKRQIANYLAGDLFSRADVDLNSYFVLALNDEPSISVVDPLFGFGGSRLLALLELESPGEDWQLTPERERLFVSLPAAGKVAVADTTQWRVIDAIKTGPEPRRLRQSADHIWAADAQGVTRIDRRTLATQALPLGRVQDLAIDAAGDYLAATLDGAVAVLDAHNGKTIHRIAVDGQPRQLDWSAAAQAFYALDAQAGKVFVLDPRQPQPRAVIAVESGAAQLRFAPGGRHALLPNPQRNRLQVLDAASNAIVQNANIPDGPEQVGFTPLLAYVQRRNSEIVQMISLDQIGRAGQRLGVAEFPAGQHALGASTATAERLAAAPEGPAVLIANAADKMIYLYREGMAAPAGGFRTYGRRPRAVMVVDHGLREGQRGEYSARMPVQKPGTYDVALFTDSPRVTACFTLSVNDPAPQAAPARVVALDPPAQLAVGKPAQLRFALLDSNNTRRASGDVHGLALLAPGTWQRRDSIAAREDGSYSLQLTPPQPGIYYVWIESAALGLTRRHKQFLVYEAR